MEIRLPATFFRAGIRHKTPEATLAGIDPLPLKIIGPLCGSPEYGSEHVSGSRGFEAFACSQLLFEPTVDLAAG